MPQLAVHQLRVGAVCKIVAENFCKEVDVQYITKLGLVHDMGNIVKFDLANRNEELYGKVKGVEHWVEIQKTYWQKYGHDAHQATVAILTEAGLGEYIPDLNAEAELYFAESTTQELEQASQGAVILMYADCRVSPRGVVPYRERIDDLVERYGGGKTDTWRDSMVEFEKYIERATSTDLMMVSEVSANELFDQLLLMPI